MRGVVFKGKGGVACPSSALLLRGGGVAAAATDRAATRRAELRMAAAAAARVAARGVGGADGVCFAAALRRVLVGSAAAPAATGACGAEARRLAGGCAVAADVRRVRLDVSVAPASTRAALPPVCSCDTTDDVREPPAESGTRPLPLARPPTPPATDLAAVAPTVGAVAPFPLRALSRAGIVNTPFVVACATIFLDDETVHAASRATRCDLVWLALPCPG
jgi:hypothetical protein